MMLLVLVMNKKSFLTNTTIHNKLKFFSRENNTCDKCKEKFKNREELIHHARHVHHHVILKCTECGKEFLHEKDRLHHAKEERENKLKKRGLS